ncbi:MAG: TfoX/Sxy family protein [Verrucomicrobia bacterium]|nr:TfoX/Sxy family protein [Verrucomicrobiota bacterium]
MAYDEQLATRVRAFFHRRAVAVEEKRMMGGLCFMVNGKMCVGVEKERLMARIDPDIYDQALARKGCVPMDFTGRPMRGFVFVNAEGLASARDLASWLELALDFNPRAKASKDTRRSRKPFDSKPDGKTPR